MSEIIPAELDPGTREDRHVPQIGEWYWVKLPKGHEKWTDDETGRKMKTGDEVLCVVGKVLSNHVRFDETCVGGGYSSLRIRHRDLLGSVRPAAEWREVIEKRMERTRARIQDATRQLRYDGIKARALPDPTTPETGSMAPAIRITDPVRVKKDLEALKKQLPVVKKEIEELHKYYVAMAEFLVRGDLMQMKQVQREMEGLESQIFTCHIYAGLDEEIVQIASGQPAMLEEPIHIHQALRMMDEETLIDYDVGGMDYTRLQGFDKWAARPETLERILPEPRGVVAFRIRRKDKDYGPASSLMEAWANAKENEYNFQTYLLIRNGDNLYRIASQIKFEPRLVPLRKEFDDAFTEVEHGWYNWEKKAQDPDTITKITPEDFEYDRHAKALKDRLEQFNRIIVVLQGLLDRSKCFHPHPEINLSKQEHAERWVKAIRDEEDVLDTPIISPQDYLLANGFKVQAGDLIYTRYPDIRRRPYNANQRPNWLRVDRVAKLAKGEQTILEHALCNIQREVDRQRFGRYPKTDFGEYDVPDIGAFGVHVSWPYGKEGKYKWVHGEAVHYEVEVKKRLRLFIPLGHFINLCAYQCGDYKPFADHTKYKQHYANWAPMFLKAEDFALGRVQPPFD